MVGKRARQMARRCTRCFGGDRFALPEHAHKYTHRYTYIHTLPLTLIASRGHTTGPIDDQQSVSASLHTARVMDIEAWNLTLWNRLPRMSFKRLGDETVELRGKSFQ